MNQLRWNAMTTLWAVHRASYQFGMKKGAPLYQHANITRASKNRGHIATLYASPQFTTFHDVSLVLQVAGQHLASHLIVDAKRRVLPR